MSTFSENDTPDFTPLPPMISLLPIIVTLTTIVLGINAIHVKDYIQLFMQQTMLWAAKTYIKTQQIGESLFVLPRKCETEDVTDGCILDNVMDINNSLLLDCNTFQAITDICKQKTVVVTYRVTGDVMRRTYKVVYSPTSMTRIPPHIHPEWDEERVVDGQMATPISVLIADLTLDSTSSPSVTYDVTDIVRSQAGPLGDFYIKAGGDGKPNLALILASNAMEHKISSNLKSARLVFYDTDGNEHEFEWDIPIEYEEGTTCEKLVEDVDES